MSTEKTTDAITMPSSTVDNINNVWGRRRTPDQQPLYSVESAEVKVDVKSQAIKAFFKPQHKPHGYDGGWLGKLGYCRIPSTNTPGIATHSVRRRNSALDALAEKMAADLYAYLSEGNYRVPKTRLAELPIKNPFTEQHALTQILYDEINEERKPPIDEGVYVLSKWVKDYQDLAKLKACVLGDEQKEFTVFLNEGKLPEHIIVKGKKLRLLGLMEILAAGRLLADTDVLGGGGNNAGIVMECDETGEATAARAVKIDPGYAFNFRGAENLFFQSKNPDAHSSNSLKQDKRHLQYGNMAPALPWCNLTVSQQQQFIWALDKGLNMLRKREEITKMVNREAFKQTPKKRVLPSLGEMLGEIEENLVWQEKTYASEIKQCRALATILSSHAVEIMNLKTALAQKEAELKEQRDQHQQHKAVPFFSRSSLGTTMITTAPTTTAAPTTTTTTTTTMTTPTQGRWFSGVFTKPPSSPFLPLKLNPGETWSEQFLATLMGFIGAYIMANLMVILTDTLCNAAGRTDDLMCRENRFRYR